MLIVIGVTLLGVSSRGSCDEPSASEIREVKRIKTTMDNAGREYQANRFKSSGESVKSAQKRLVTLLKDADEELIALIKPEYDRIKKAHELLAEKGVDLDALPALAAAGDPAAEGISFVKQVAPILNAKCGGCHVTRSQGRFSLASYQVLMRGPAAGVVVMSEKPDDSRLIEVIESGDMPRGGLTVSADELKILKDWITAGAKFDGEDPAANLAQLNPGDPEPAMPESQLTVEKATGNETISFAVDVAPVFVENCGGCHFEAQNARGGLTLNRFVDVLRGGDGGAMIKPGEPDASTLIKRLRGEGGNRMPVGRDPLSDETINKIAKWIEEGAKFDGREANLNLRSVYALAKADRATHEQLLDDRQKLTEENWRKVMSGEDVNRVSTEHFVVVGSAEKDKLNLVAQMAEKQTEALRSFFKLNKTDPLVKGNITIYAFFNRYNYSEFGKMIEKRDLPRNWQGHWGFTTVDAYVVLQIPKDEPAAIEPDLARYIASTMFASNGVEIPSWYADGVGYVFASKEFSKSELADQWQQKADQAIAQLEKGDEYVKGQVGDDFAALAGFRFAEASLRSKNKFYKLIDLLKQGTPFADAFVQSYGAKPEDAAISLRRQFGR
jgi:mono/diheme cytochrome c family protein